MQTISNKYMPLLCKNLFAFIMMIAVLFSYSATAQSEIKPPESGNYIIVSGQGQAIATPDIGVINATIDHEAREHDTAMQQASRSMAQLIEAMKNLGIKESDLKTGSVSMYPVYAPNSRIITGWRANAGLQITVRDLSKFGAITNRLAELKIGQFWGPNLQVEDMRPVYNQARIDAIADAQKAAEAMAKAANLRLISIRRIMDETSPVHENMLMSTMAMRAEASYDSAASMPVMAGEQKITARVTVIWEVVAE